MNAIHSKRDAYNEKSELHMKLAHDIYRKTSGRRASEGWQEGEHICQKFDFVLSTVGRVVEGKWYDTFMMQGSY